MILHPQERQLYELMQPGAHPAPRLSRHVAMCPRCRARAGEFGTILRLGQTLANVPEPREGFEARLWARLQTAEPRTVRWLATFCLAAPVGRWWAGFDCRQQAPALLVAPPNCLDRSWRRAGLGGGLALLVLIGAAGLWHLRQPGVSPPSAPAGRVTAVRARVVRAAAAGQLERAEMLLVALAHAPASNSATVVDLSLEQNWARELVDTDRLVQQSATWNGQARLAEVLADLEPVLLQIAHSPAAVTRSQWQNLQDRVDSSGLLFRVRTASRNLAASAPSFEDGTL